MDKILGYHVTPTAALEHIQRGGLEPRIGPRALEANESEPAIYFFASQEDYENGISNWLGECFDEEEPLCLLIVDITHLPRRESEVPWEHAVECIISPLRIREIRSV